MKNKIFFKGFIIVVITAFCFSILQSGTYASTSKKIKSNVKTEKQQAKSVRCNNCPSNCLIKSNQTGKCGQYKNIKGKLVPVKK